MSIKQTFKSVTDIVKLVESPLRDFHVGPLGDGYYVQVRFDAKCAKTGRIKSWSGRKWYVSPHSTESEIVQTCLKALITSLEHEARESFKYDNVAIFQPHFDVNALMDLASSDANLDGRD